MQEIPGKVCSQPFYTLGSEMSNTVSLKYCKMLVSNNHYLRSRLVWCNIILKDTKSFQRCLKAEVSSLKKLFEGILLITGLTLKTNHSALFPHLMALSISVYSPET